MDIRTKIPDFSRFTFLLFLRILLDGKPVTVLCELHQMGAAPPYIWIVMILPSDLWANLLGSSTLRSQPGIPGLRQIQLRGAGAKSSALFLIGSTRTFIA